MVNLIHNPDTITVKVVTVWNGASLVEAPLNRSLNQFDLVRVVTEDSQYMYLGCITIMDSESMWLTIDRQSEYWYDPLQYSWS
jgi:hypothetical protein